MPIPKPNEDEEQGAFVARCVAALDESEGDAKVRTAICYDSWRRVHGISASEAIDASFASQVSTKEHYGWQAASAEFEEDGKAVKRFVKSVIRVGSFFKEASNKTFVVTPATLSYWSQTFRQMKERGTKVWIPRSHEDANVSDHNRGYVDDLFVVDDTLFMSCRLIGKDAIAAAQRNDVSIHCPASFTDDGGKTFRMPIRHVALCPDPVVSGLSSFVEVDEFSERDSTMAKQWWADLVKELDLSDVTEENATQRVLAAVKKLKVESKSKTSLSSGGAADDVTKDAEKKDEPASKTAEVKFAVSPIQLSAIASARRAQIGTLVEKGKVTADVAKQLVTKFVGDEQADKLAVTLSGSGDDDFNDVFSMFDANEPVALAELTRGQHSDGNLMVLSNDATGEDNPLLANAEKRAKAAG